MLKQGFRVDPGELEFSSLTFSLGDFSYTDSDITSNMAYSENINMSEEGSGQIKLIMDISGIEGECYLYDIIFYKTL